MPCTTRKGPYMEVIRRNETMYTKCIDINAGIHAHQG